MQDLAQALQISFQLIFALESHLIQVVSLSMHVSLIAVLISATIALPLAATLALGKFPGRKIITLCINVFMGLPPVVVGLFVYILISRSGPFGVWGLLFTPTAMIIAQVILVIPIMTAIARQIFEELNQEYSDLFNSLGVPLTRRIATILWDGRFTLTTAGLAGFGRAISEVGAVMIVGGNIDELTRVMTTSIALEARKGDLSMAMALGIILIFVALTVNLITYALTELGKTGLKK